jgi:calcium-dependent protein kinase
LLSDTLNNFILCVGGETNIAKRTVEYKGDCSRSRMCTGGDLFDRLDDQSDYHYSGAQCAKLVKQMLSTVRYLHSKKIVHRYLKFEKMFTSQSPYRCSK